MAQKDGLDVVEPFAAPAAALPQWDDAHGTVAETPSSNGHVNEGPLLSARSRVAMMPIVPAEEKQAPSPLQRQNTRGHFQGKGQGDMMDKLQSNLAVLRKEVCPLAS